MAFTVEDYHDLVRLLWEHPEWREELRRLLLTSELLALPEMVKDLTKAQRETERRLSALAEEVRGLAKQVSILTQGQQRLTEEQQRLTEQVRALTEGQQRLTEQVRLLTEGQQQLREEQQRLTEQVRALTEGQQRLTEQVRSLTEGQRRLTEQVRLLTEGQQQLREEQQRLTEQVRALTEGQQRLTEQVRSLTEGQQRLTERVDLLTDTVGRMKGTLLEMNYQRKASAYFGLLLRRVKVVDLSSIDDVLTSALTSEELRDMLQIDLLVSGRLRHLPESPEIMLAVEISSVVDRNDVLRAVQRAKLLRKAGYSAVPVVCGEEVTKGGRDYAEKQSVVLLRDGGVEFWGEALSSWGIP
ncbi:hypothetical protein J7M22_18255 [Candidatus Poribacteria bacterium]|nr:hypothetical protein [Candidatus Poribacteria bacterium]